MAFLQDEQDAVDELIAARQRQINDLTASIAESQAALDALLAKQAKVTSLRDKVDAERKK